jgi:hypothetical protein
MKKTVYQQAKTELRKSAKEFKKQFLNDKPALRMVINDTADFLSKNYSLSDYQINLLNNYACKLHPKT